MNGGEEHFYQGDIWMRTDINDSANNGLPFPAAFRFHRREYSKSRRHV